MLKLARRSALVAAFVVPVVSSAPALGAECLDVTVPDSVNVGSADLALNGLGIRKATFLKVKVYVAGLYLPQKANDAAQVHGDGPWQLVLHFVRDVDASDIRDAFNEGFEKAAGGNLAALRPRIDALNARVVDVKKGQYLAFANDPAKGVAIDANGAGGSAIEGADFATALLAVWIGKEPPNEDLKAGLLGGKCE
ncbi:MAG: chalcone isomerase family protein [Dongiaceae bacterium]